MNRRITLLITASLMVLAMANAGELNLIPWPSKVTQHAGAFVLNPQTVLIANPTFTNEATRLAGELHLETAATAKTNRIQLTSQGSAGLGPEAYRLEVNPQGVTIHAHSPAGAFYGCQTLQQLLDPAARTIPCVTIEDSPRYAWRGLMLDVSRHFFDKSTVEQVLDWMAQYKLNRFHMHLTDDQGWRLEIKKYPELTRIGAQGNYSDPKASPRFFTHADLRDIVAYAKQRHIVVVPEIDMPGHASAATRTFPQLDGGMHTYNPARPETYVFLQNVLLDVMSVFPSPWIHFGGDEVNSSGWHVTEQLKADGVNTPAQMESYFVRRMSQFIAQHGRTPVGWDEIMSAHPPKNTVVFWWRHNRPDSLKQALASGYDVVLTPRSPCYFDYPQDKSYPKIGWGLYNTPEAVYSGPKIPADISPAQRRQILGVEGCVWTEHIASKSYLEFKLLPRTAALGEMAWTADAQRNYAQFDNRLQSFVEQYRKDGLHYYDAQDPTGSLRAAKSGQALQPTTASAPSVSRE